jgi:SAM-dependent methyltransferase
VISWNEFRDIGREQWHVQKNPLVRMFTRLFGPIGIHSRIRAGHVLKTIKGLDLRENARILDAGSGRGLVLFWLATRNPDYELVGVEIDPRVVAQTQAVAKALSVPPPEFRHVDLSTIELLEAQCDLVISIDVLEHIPDDVGVLRKLRRVVKPEGYLLLHLPLRHQEQQRIFPVFKRHVISDHVRDEYLPDEIERKLESAGFLMQALYYGFGWQGELAFELNTLLWWLPPARALLAALTYPLAWWLALWDVNSTPRRGNSMIIVARTNSAVTGTNHSD